MYNLKNRSFLTLRDFTPDEIKFLIDLSYDLKKQKYRGESHKELLKNKNIVILFQKTSTRTRAAFEVGGADLGMHVTYLDPVSSQMGKKESVEDTAKVLGRMYDGIEFRGSAHEDVEILADHAGIPVWNGLTDLYHPTQILADFLTIFEKKGKLKGIKFTYVGDARNNMGNSLMIGAAKLGLDFRSVSPKELQTEDEIYNYCQKIAKETGAKITRTIDWKEGTEDTDVIYTDVWVSMGEPKEVWDSRIKLLKDYQVNMNMVRNASKEVLFMHCLPAFHNTETQIGKEIKEKYNLDAMEVTDEVFRSKHSVVFQEAENRMHTIKAIILATIGY